MQEYNNRIIEFAHANTNAAFDFVQKLSGVKWRWCRNRISALFLP